jgi:hypothetical protein
LRASAEEGYISFLEGAIQGLTVHETNHQDFPIGALDHGGKQPVHFVEIKFCIHTGLLLAFQKTKSPLSVIASAG